MLLELLGSFQVGLHLPWHPEPLTQASPAGLGSSGFKHVQVLYDLMACKGLRAQDPKHLKLQKASYRGRNFSNGALRLCERIIRGIQKTMYVCPQPKHCQVNPLETLGLEPPPQTSPDFNRQLARLYLDDSYSGVGNMNQKSRIDSQTLTNPRTKQPLTYVLMDNTNVHGNLS